MTIIRSRYRPREFFRAFHSRGQRWAILVAHRRAGKTVAVVNDLIEKASYNTRPDPRYAYIAPFLKQAKDIAWTYLKNFSAPFAPKINESSLFVELTALPNNPRITIYGADNPDSFRGLYLDGAVLDEFGNMRNSVFKEILLPALIDRRGWCVLMGTPNGPNHYRDMWYEYREDPTWFSCFLPVSATNLISEQDLAMMRKMMDPEQYAQEMECSFEASVRGAIYARQMEEMERDRRIGDYPAQKGIPVHVIADLGFRDLTVMGFYQERPDGVLLDKVYAANLQPISHYIQQIDDYFRESGHRRGEIWLPHDARAKSLQTGKSIVELFMQRKYRPRIVPELSLIDGIAATRELFPVVFMNKEHTKDHVLAMKSYHRKYDEERQIYLDEPVHDWSSHYADMHRYMSLVANRKSVSKGRPIASFLAEEGAQATYSFSLNDIWDCGPVRRTRI